MSALAPAVRVELWHRALQGVRSYFVDQGLREVSTPVRLDAVAAEPFIEPIEASGLELATSPELPMKRLLAAGSGPIFQIAPVFRRGETGRIHKEEFRLVEWYRLEEDEAAVRRDVEAVVDAVCGAAEAVLGPRARPSGWSTHRWFDVFAETTGVVLDGTEGAAALIERVGSLWPADPPGFSALTSTRARDLMAWTTVFTSWSDRHLDPWLADRGAVHLVAFPRALAALSRGTGPGTSARFESHLGGLEVANGYGELTDAVEQAERFAAVAELRRALGERTLAEPTAFLASLRRGLPPCSGAAMGLDRLLMWAAGEDRLEAIDPLA